MVTVVTMAILLSTNSSITIIQLGPIDDSMFIHLRTECKSSTSRCFPMLSALDTSRALRTESIAIEAPLWQNLDQLYDK